MAIKIHILSDIQPKFLATLLHCYIVTLLHSFIDALLTAYCFANQNLRPNFASKKMYLLLVTIVLALFAAMLFVNVYFRVRVLKTYKKLVQNKVEFGAAHLFNKKRMEEEIFPRYPHMKEDIQTFVNYMKYTIKMASVLIALITLFGAILMYYR